MVIFHSDVKLPEGKWYCQHLRKLTISQRINLSCSQPHRQTFQVQATVPPVYTLQRMRTIPSSNTGGEIGRFPPTPIIKKLAWPLGWHILPCQELPEGQTLVPKFLVQRLLSRTTPRRIMLIVSGE